jgi:hypothetical protein
MIWLTWRQFRTSAWVASAALAATAVLLAVTGLHLAHLYDASGIATCHAHGDCSALAGNFLSQAKSGALYHSLYLLGIAVLYVAPAVIGMFWGAPLITREIEAGTFRLAWNQSVTRTRWLAVKLGLTGLAAMATGGLLSLMVSWSDSPIDRAAGLAAGSGPALLSRITPLLFGARGIVPVGYAAFAVVLGVTAGVLIRRTVPAMAVTLVVFAAIQIIVPNWVRPHLIAPARATTALTAASINGVGLVSNGTGPGVLTVFANVNEPGAWVLSNQTITAAGRAFTGPVPQACNTPSFQACQVALGKLHLRQLVTYQPASRFWALQWRETAIFLVLAAALAGFCFWRVRRRRLS